MEQKDKAGIEAIVDARQKKDIFERIGTYAGTAVSGIGAAGSAGMVGLSVYKAIEKYIGIDPSLVVAAAMADEETPYDICYAYAIIALMAGIATISFLYGVFEGVRRIRE